MKIDIFYLIPLFQYMISVLEIIENEERRERLAAIGYRSTHILALVNILVMITDMFCDIMELEKELKIHMLVHYVTDYE